MGMGSETISVDTNSTKLNAVTIDTSTVSIVMVRY